MEIGIFKDHIMFFKHIFQTSSIKSNYVQFIWSPKLKYNIF